MHTTAPLLTIAVLLGFSNVSLAARFPIHAKFSYGWGTEVQQLAAVPTDAPIAAEFQGSAVYISYKWDQLWFGVPLWISNGGYIIEVVSANAAPQYFALKSQEPKSIASLAGTTPDSLSPPLFSRFPIGYVVLFFVYVVVQLISGPSPRKRFVRLIYDSRYQNALDLLTRRHTEFTASETTSDDAETVDAKMQRCYAESIELLVEQGVSRSKANRNLRFMIGYLENNPHNVPARTTT